MGLEVLAPQFPDSVLARASYRLPFIEKDLKVDANTIIVGHSSGAIAAMRIAEKHKIYGSVLVGTYYTDLGIDSEKVSDNFDKPWDWEAIKKNQNWIIEFASTDDPWIPIEEARYVHEKLNSEYYEYHDEGHFGGDTNKLEFPQLVRAIKNRVGSKRRLALPLA